MSRELPHSAPLHLPPRVQPGRDRIRPGSRRGAAGTVAKRAFDLAGATVLCIALLPLLLTIAGLQWFGGSAVLYRHRRVGRDGLPFDCLKFQTMRPDADAVLARLLATDAALRAEWQASRKLRHDPRVTRLGRLLRATSLDELPQLFNVLRGDMSLVGPRPVVQAELDQFYGPEGRGAYCSVRPGLTGPWQVSGRSDTGYAERVRLDIRYVEDQSLALDLRILWQTVGVVLSCRGAR